MADAPIGLRQADPTIYKTAMRAEQLQSVKPIVAYWCDYWVLKQILARGLHNGNPDILEYSSRLMDKMEQVKDTYGSEEAITDDMAGQAYIEQFAQETLDRAQRVVKAGKVTPTTANTFDAAATFFSLVNIWGAPDAETLQKIKYAKWNAARILKAVKEGRDPNESNPKPDELPQEDEDGQGQPEAADDDNDRAPPPVPSSAPRPVTIEDGEDGEDVDGGTRIPMARRDSAGVSLPHSPASPALAPAPAPAPQHTSAAPPALPPVFAPSPQSTAAVAPPPLAVPYPAHPPAPSAPPAAYASAPTTTPAPAPIPASAPTAAALQPNAVVDDMAMVTAQKHAKWAISALNFEDVPTAVRELRLALQQLGAS